MCIAVVLCATKCTNIVLKMDINLSHIHCSYSAVIAHAQYHFPVLEVYWRVGTMKRLGSLMFPEVPSGACNLY